MAWPCASLSGNCAGRMDHGPDIRADRRGRADSRAFPRATSLAPCAPGSACRSEKGTSLFGKRNGWGNSTVRSTVTFRWPSYAPAPASAPSNGDRGDPRRPRHPVRNRTRIASPAFRYFPGRAVRTCPASRRLAKIQRLWLYFLATRWRTGGRSPYRPIWRQPGCNPARL